MADRFLSKEQLIKEAEGGTPRAQFELGCYYEDHDQFTEAKRYYELAAAQAFPPAIHNLACLYERAQGVAEDLRKAESLYREAIEYKYGPSFVNLARLYTVGGDGLEQDLGEAFALAYQGAESGDDEAQIMLGGMYENGLGVPKDDAAALSWYEKAKQQGSPAADAYIQSLNSRKEAAASGQLPDWMSGYIDMAEGGDASAMYAIGYMYYLGQAIPQDYAKAVEWFTKAAEKNYDFGLFFLAECYKNGQGVPADIEKAKEYYRKAADLGNDAAKTALKAL